MGFASREAEKTLRLTLVDDAAYAFPKRRCAEVEEESQRQIEQTQISEDLLDVHGRRPFNRLEFDQQASVQQQVGDKGAAEVGPVEGDVDRLLPIDLDPLSFEPRRKQRLIDAFEKAGPKLAVKPEGGVDSGPGKALGLQVTGGAEHHFPASTLRGLAPAHYSHQTRIGIST